MTPDPDRNTVEPVKQLDGYDALEHGQDIDAYWATLLCDSGVTSEAIRRRLLDAGATDVPSAEVVEAMQGIIDAMCTATVWGANAQFWVKVKAAHDSLHGITEQGRRRSVVELLTFHLEGWRDPRQRKRLNFASREDVLTWLLRLLPDYDPAFKGLVAADVEVVLGAVKMPSARSKKTKGGSGNLSIRGLAARLSVKCGAFADTDQKKAKQAFDDAFKQVKQRKTKRARR